MLPLLLAGLLTAGAATPGWSDRRVPSEAPAPPAEPTAGPNHVEVFKDPDGFKLLIDGEPTFVAGMNWGYVPIGENYSYDFWGKSDTFIIEALHSEMTLLRRMGVNLSLIHI